MEKTVYTVSEVQEMLGIGRGVAYRLCTGKEFPVRRVGRTILIPIKSFNDWLYCDKKEEFVSDQAVTDTNKVAS